MLILGKFLSNVNDPYGPDAKMKHTYSFDARHGGPEAMELEWQEYLQWIRSNVIGPPKATDYFTEDQLREMGMVGIYAQPFDIKLEK